MKKPGNETEAEAEESGKAADKATAASEEAEAKNSSEEEDAAPQDAKAEVRQLAHLSDSSDTSLLLKQHWVTYVHQQAG